MMEGLYIVNYCSPGCSPLQSITRLPEDEAYAQAKRLVDTNEGTAFGRFADFVNYYPLRIRTEKWLHEGFVEQGGQPETEHPLYFVLHGSEYLNRWFGEGTVTRLSLANIKPEHISFTFGDSMAKMDRPERKQPMGMAELLEQVEAAGGIDAFLDGIKDQYTYIEAQLWSDQYVMP